MLLFVLISFSTIAQNQSQQLSATEIDAAVAGLNENQSLSDADKTEALDLLSRADRLLTNADGLTAQIDQFELEAASIEALTNELAAALIVASDLPQMPAETAAPDTVRSQVAIHEADLAAAILNRNQLRTLQSTLTGRASAIAEEISVATEALNNLQQSTAGAPSAEINSLENARQWFSLAQQVTQQRLIADLQRELDTIPPRLSITADRLDVSAVQINSLNEVIQQLNARLSATIRGRAQVARAAAQANIERFASTPSALTAIAQENLNLATQLETIVGETPALERATRNLIQQIDSLRQSEELASQILDTGSQTDELGELMRNVRLSLPRRSNLRQRLADNDEARVSLRLNQILWRDRLQRLANPADAAFRLMTTATESVPSISIDAETRAEAASLVVARQSILTDLIQAAQTASDRLADQAIALNDNLLQSQSLTELLDRRLLWLRNSDSHPRNLVANFPQSVAWLLSPSAWRTVISNILGGVITNPLIALFAILIPLLILRQRPQLKQRLRALSNRVGNVGQDTYLTTPEALLICVVLALPWPLLIWAVGFVLALADNLEAFSQALVPTMTSVATLLFILSFFRHMARPAGVFETHFNWSPTSRRNLRRHLNWFAWVECSVAFVYTMAISTGETEFRYSLGLFAFVIGSISLALLSFQFFKPNGGIISDIILATPATPVLVIAFPFLVAIPFLLGIIPLFGYFDTAETLQTNVFISGIVLLGSAIVFGLAMRLFMIGHRRLALKKAREKRAKIEAERAISSDAEASGEAIPVAVAEPEVDTETISAQIRNTLYALAVAVLLVGLWATWNPLLPALGIATDLVLWQNSTIIDGIEIANPVTLWSIILAVLFLVGGFLAAGNIRGFLEVGVFSRTKLDAGARYAAVTIAGYILVAIGVVGGFSQLGIDWSRLQWIIAALGVGLGFGLQEIVANFVSGLIILFERPVRVGDVVTIGNLSGTVTNIRIRAATITDFDNHEVLLPNKTIITENVINWTLTDAVTRLVINIGVAYGSDVTFVHDLLLKTVATHPDVLVNPLPTVFFISHGDSSLNFEIRVFVTPPTKRLPVTHDLNVAINIALAENGIEIPFPQRDLHVKNLQDLRDTMKSND